MKKLIIATVLSLGLAPMAFAQTTPTAPSATPPAASATSDAAVDAKFKAADKNGNGSLESTELDSATSGMLAQLDTDKDGKLSRTEYMAGVKAGQIK